MKKDRPTRDNPEAYKAQRSRNYIAVLYPDNEKHAAAAQIIESSREITWAGITHDRDTEPDGSAKKLHFHYIFKFENARELGTVARALGLGDDDWRFLEVPDKFNVQLRYLVHADDPDKYQYDLHDVRGPLAGALGDLLDKDTPEGVRALAILDWIESIDSPLSFTTLIRWACENGYYDIIRRNGYSWTLVVKEHNAIYG